MNHSLILNPPFILKINPLLKKKLVLKMFWLFSILLIIALLVFYIFQVNAEVSERYLIKKYETRLRELSGENQMLEINAIQSSSLDNIVELVEPLNFEKTDRIYYIKMFDTQVVAK